MTCIVGYVEKETVYLGGDSAGTDDNFFQHIRKDPKVFRNGPFIFGFTSSFRMGQILMSSKFKPWKQKPGQSDYDYMITDFIDAVRKAFKKCGYLQKTEQGDEQGGTFLVGYKGKLFYVEDDFQVGEIGDVYTSVGCGSDLALGSMHTQEVLSEYVESKPEFMITIALQAASKFSAGVSAPYNFISMNKRDSEKEIEKLETRDNYKKKMKDKVDKAKKKKK